MMKHKNILKSDITQNNIIAYSKMTESGVNLFVLREVDTTIDVLCKKSDGVSALITAGGAIIEALKALENHINSDVDSIDPNGEIVDSLELSADLTRRLISHYVSKSASIDGDRNVPTHHKESLHDAYEHFLQTLALHEQTMSTMSDLLIGFELARESRGAEPTFNNADSLRAHIMQ